MLDGGLNKLRKVRGRFGDKVSLTRGDVIVDIGGASADLRS
jgi:hypothetical protein